MSTTNNSQIILLTTASRAAELQAALQESLRAPVFLVSSFAEASSVISAMSYSAVIVDESLADLEPNNANRFLARLTDELPIFVKLAISGVPRCVRQVQLALRRFEREQQAASYSISAQVRDFLTSILVHSQLAMKVSELPADAYDHIDSVLRAAEELQERLGERSTR